MFQADSPFRPTLSRCRFVKNMTIAAMLLASGMSAQAQSSWHDVIDIEDTARAFAERATVNAALPTDIQVNKVDPRLRVHQCRDALEAYLPSGGQLQRNGVVGVRCTGPVAWKLFVPVRLVQTAEVAHVVGHHPAGHRLTDADVSWIKQALRGNPTAFFRGQHSPVGQVLRQAAQDGQLLRPNMLRAANVIRRGDQVTLAVSGSALAIRMSGEALSDAALGQRIQARNRSSGRVVEGIARGEGLVELTIF